MITYEYPFNERIRTLLRMEDLYERYTHFLGQTHPLEHHVALTTVFEMLEVTCRADPKTDILQELDRQKQLLSTLSYRQRFGDAAISDIVKEIDSTVVTLMNLHGKTGQEIRENEWLMSLRYRINIPGGACRFDLPSYYAWQQRPPERRARDIAGWFSSMQPIIDAARLVLRVLRATGNIIDVVAESGSYQKMLQGKTYQLLRISFDVDLETIPETSANRYMLWIRFTRQDGVSKPKPYDKDVPCKLTLC